MFVYEKKLQYPVNIKHTNPKLAKIIITQYGGAYSNSLYLLKSIPETIFYGLLRGMNYFEKRSIK